MLRLTEKLSREKHYPVYFIVADSDQRSQPKVAASSVRVASPLLPSDFESHHFCGRADGVTAHGVGDYTSQPRSRPIVELIGAHDGLLVGLLDVRDATAATPGYHL